MTTPARLAAQLVDAPWEAQCTAAVLASATADGAEIRCLPMTVGSLRAVRDFSFTARPGDALPLLLTALGACVATTAAASLTLRGNRPRSLTVRASCDTSGLGVTLGRPADRVALEHVRRFSPIHTLLAGPGDLRLRGATTEVVTYTPAAEVSMTWTDGMYAHGDRDVDEPRQLGGTDRAPSPLEYVLAALAAETLSSPGEQAHASARRDLRGWLGFPGLPPEPRALLVQCMPGGQTKAGVIAHLVGTPRQIRSDVDVS